MGLALLTIPVVADAATVEHVVVRGQTLVRIARRYRTTVDILREVNGLKPEDQLRPGQRLVIPERGKEAEAARKAAALRKEEARKEAARKEKEAARLEAARKDKEPDRKPTTGKKADRPGDRKDDRKAKPSKEDEEQGYARKPKRPGFVRMVRGGEGLEVQLLNRNGRLNPKALPKITHLLRSAKGGLAIDPRLATLVGMVSDHFGGRTIRVVSGYRPYSPTQYTPRSNHNLGRAMDFSIDGVPNTVVRDFCRTFRNAGVGYYPNSSFIHLDVRSAKTYWVDYSRPGEAPRYSRGSPPPAEAEGPSDMEQTSRHEASPVSAETPPSAAESGENSAGVPSNSGTSPSDGED
ncbi:DUF882 domain-containing protein [Chondromyces apiculatus]|uniref:DUF882 domain-containing protein n=1 Tax=Chondromyces apiculatus TaxID=51 RepID=UPI000693BC02|nr:DUF882 domain-containing protein [Chondromyces apiculatus]